MTATTAAPATVESTETYSDGGRRLHFTNGVAVALHPDGTVVWASHDGGWEFVLDQAFHGGCFTVVSHPCDDDYLYTGN